MFSPIKNTRVYEKAIEQIKDMIVEGTFKREINFLLRGKWQKAYKLVELL